MGYSAVRTKNAKYIQYRDLEGMNELYDLDADPYEEHNLIASPAAAALLKTMQGELERLTRAAAPAALRHP
jgi:arylsulfatase A-like enzyme